MEKIYSYLNILLTTTLIVCNISISAEVIVKKKEALDFERLKIAMETSTGSECAQKKMKALTNSKSEKELNAMGDKIMVMMMKFAKECMCSKSAKNALKEEEEILKRHPKWKGEVVTHKVSETNFDSLDMKNSDDVKKNFEKECK